MMNQLIKQDQNLWVQSASNWLERKIIQYNSESVYIPAGETPKILYKYWTETNPFFLKKIKLVQIDEVSTGYKKKLFEKFFKNHLPLHHSQIEFISSGGTQADLAILGLGTNGHVAFHEPGLSQNFYSGCVKLSSETIHNLQLEEKTWGTTYGLGAFNACKAILMMVNGEKKMKIVIDLINRNDPNKLPASGLKTHQDFTLLTDFEY
jgi:6-phosphogluconolactonase/glucosamine-6-phosphate isomerase/deaminase